VQSGSTTRVVLIRHASTTATRAASFPLEDDPLDRFGREDAESLAGALGPRSDVYLCGPSRRARETAQALGLASALVEPALDECDFGSWRGRTLEAIHAADPDGAVAWMTDPAAAPHGGESLLDVLERVRGWMGGVAGGGARIVAITHAGVIRAAIVVALGAPPEAFWRIDVSPLSQTLLHERDGRWTLRALRDDFGG
jgi:broad specificity phosphatase PhoE